MIHPEIDLLLLTLAEDSYFFDMRHNQTGCDPAK